MLLGAWLGSIIGLEIGNNEGTKLGFWDGKVIGTTLGTMNTLSLGPYDGIDMGSTDRNTYGKFEVLLLGA